MKIRDGRPGAAENVGWLTRLFGGKKPKRPEPEVVCTNAAAAGSDIGLQRRNNEDSFLFEPARGLYAVCDGIGGHAAGELASAIAVSMLGDQLSAERLAAASAEGEAAVHALCTSALQEVNQAILTAAMTEQGWVGMGCTAVIAVYAGNKLYVANTGDSRAYLVRKKAPMLLTRDHTVAVELSEKGEIPPEEIREHPLRDHLTSALGAEIPLIIDTNTVELQPEDRLVLCSDGLWDMVSDEEIARVTADRQDPMAAVYSLIDAANAAGGWDNITVIVVHLAV